MKKLILFICLFFVSLGVVSSVECSTNIEENCTVSNSLTFNRTDSFNFNGTDSFSEGVLKINGSNLILDLNSSTIYGNWSLNDDKTYQGIYVTGDNVTIKNGFFENYQKGIRFQTQEDSTVYNCTFTNNSRGIYARSSLNLNLSDIVTNYSQSGIDLQFSTNDSSINNLKSYNDVYGVDLPKAYNITIKNSYFNNAFSQAIYARIGSLLNITNNVFYKNNKTIYFLSTYGNSYIMNNNFTGGVDNGDFLRIHGDDILINYNIFFNHSSYQAIRVGEGADNISIFHNSLDYQSKAIYIENATNIDIFNNTINRSITNYDGWNIGIYLQDTNKTQRIGAPINIIIRNNTIENYGCDGILIRGAKNVTIKGNVFNQNTDNYYSTEQVRCSNEPKAAIFVCELYRGYIPVGTVLGDAYDVASIHNSTIINIEDNTFNSNVKMFLRTQGTTNLTHDLSSYWFRSWRLPYLLDRDDFYISNNFNNISTIDSSYDYTETLYQGIGGIGVGDPNWSISYSIYNTYSYFKNIRTDSLNPQINIYNLTNALIYYSNGSTPCSDINTCDNNINITLTPNNYSYVLDNFNLTEGISRTNSPLAFSSSSTDEKKYITSTLTTPITVPITFNIGNYDCNDVNKITYISNTGAYKQTWHWGDFSCSSRTITLTITGIEQASSSNTIEISYDLTTFARTIIKLLVGFICLIVVAVSLGGFFIYVKNNYEDISNWDWIKYVITLLIAVFLMTALINYIVTEVL